MATETELAELLNAEMQKRHFGLRDAAKVMGTSHPTLGRALATGEITFELGVKIAKFLHLPPEQVFRLAGLIPQISPHIEQRDKLLYLFDLLPFDEQDRMIRYLQATVSILEQENKIKRD